MVNGLVWPKMNVDRGAYRFRILDGSTARFYNLSFSNGMPFTVIGVEGGYLQAPVTATNILIAPGERFDVIADFSAVPAGTNVTLLNSAPGPFPDGDPVDPATTGQIMQFAVGKQNGAKAPKLPAALNPTLAGIFPTLPNATVNRSLVLTEVMGEGGPLELLLDGQRYDAAISELPQVGTTEEWIIANPTADTHPIHLHLVQFQVVETAGSTTLQAHYDAWLAANSAAGNGEAPPCSGPTVNVSVEPYLFGAPNATGGDRDGMEGHGQDEPRRGDVDQGAVRHTERNSLPVRPDHRVLRLALPHHRPRGQRDDAALPGRPVNPPLFSETPLRRTPCRHPFRDRSVDGPGDRPSGSGILPAMRMPAGGQKKKGRSGT